MIGVLNGVVIILATVTFLGIVWWAFSRGRAKDNEEAAMLPFDLPDEGQAVKPEGGKNE